MLHDHSLFCTTTILELFNDAVPTAGVLQH
jgi:hypothetical protein